VSKIGASLKVVARALQRLELEKPQTDKDRFSVVMGEFYANAVTQLAELEEKLAQAKQSMTDLLVFYGEDPQTASSSEIFIWIHRFRQMVERAKLEVLKQDEIKVRRGQRLLGRKDTIEAEGVVSTFSSGEKAPEIQITVVDTSGGEESIPGIEGTRVMDDLIAKLKGGDTIRKMRTSIHLPSTST